MPEEKLTIADEFLSTIGRRVHEVIALKEGDIVGITSPTEGDVRLSYVESIHSNPTFTKFDDFPYVTFKGPYIGFPVSRNSGGHLSPVGYTFASISPEHQLGRFWCPRHISPWLSQEKQQLQRESLEDRELKELFEDDKKRVYSITDDSYRSLGNLIPLIELPSLSFLPKSRDREELVRMIRASEPDMKALREVSARLKRTFNCC